MLKKQLLLIFVSALLLLSACQPTSESHVDLNQPVDQLTVKKITCGDLKTQEYHQECEERLNTVAGQILAQEVIATFDLARCDILPYDQIESCKTQLQSSGIESPITLEQAQALVHAIAPVLPQLSAEELQALTEEERDALQPEYQLSTCQNLPAENGLKAYCENRVKEKIELAQLKEAQLNNRLSDCSAFTTSLALWECQNILGIKTEETEEI